MRRALAGAFASWQHAQHAQHAGGDGGDGWPLPGEGAAAAFPGGEGGGVIGGWWRRARALLMDVGGAGALGVRGPDGEVLLSAANMAGALSFLGLLAVVPASLNLIASIFINQVGDWPTPPCLSLLVSPLLPRHADAPKRTCPFPTAPPALSPSPTPPLARSATAGSRDGRGVLLRM